MQACLLQEPVINVKVSAGKGTGGVEDKTCARYTSHYSKIKSEMKVWLSPLILRSLNLISLYWMIFPRHLRNSMLGIADTSHVLITSSLSVRRCCNRPCLYLNRHYLETLNLHNSFWTSDMWEAFFCLFLSNVFFSFFFFKSDLNSQQPCLQLFTGSEYMETPPEALMIMNE